MNFSKYKLTLVIIITSLSLTYYNADYEYNCDYEILDDSSNAYGKYSKGLVYIGNEDFFKNIEQINSGDILIDENDKSMKIISSYRILNKNDRNDIINILKNYEQKNNTKYNRSLESMRMEWFVHNLLYYCNIKRERTKDVDFENSEENIYNIKVLSKILKI